MIKLTISIRLTMRQAVCLALILVLNASLFTAGAIGSVGCDMECCRQTGPSSMLSSAKSHMQAPMGRCTGFPLRPCDIQSAKPLKLQEIILVSHSSRIPGNDGPMIIVANSLSIADNPLKPSLS